MFNLCQMLLKFFLISIEVEVIVKVESFVKVIQMMGGCGKVDEVVWIVGVEVVDNDVVKVCDFFVLLQEMLLKFLVGQVILLFGLKVDGVCVLVLCGCDEVWMVSGFFVDQFCLQMEEICVNQCV